VGCQKSGAPRSSRDGGRRDMVRGRVLLSRWRCWWSGPSSTWRCAVCLSCWCSAGARRTPKRPSSWSCATNWPFCAASTHGLSSNPKTVRYWRRSVVSCPGPMVELRGHAPDAGSMAPPHGAPTLDLPSPATRPTTGSRPRPDRDRWAGHREPTLGLPAEDATAIGFLIRDRDSKFTRAFDDIWHGLDAEVIRTPIQAPNPHAVAERWVATVRRECLDHLLIAGRRQLVRVLHLSVEHDNRYRPHRGLGP
jgi:hypothetical protein